jgi:Na+/pantothenate symporter
VIKRVVVYIFALVVLVTPLIGCGGGFDHDSENANNIDKPIFGPDSIPDDIDSETISSYESVF